MIQAKADFQRWATGYSGFDGGNPRGPIWFCGIEYGGGEDRPHFGFDVDVTEPGSISADETLQFIGHPYNSNAVKLYSAILGDEPGKYKDIARSRRVFGKDSDLFKLNLYPLSFHTDNDDLWEEWHFEKTGLPTKSLYRAWCQVHRFARFTAWTRQHAPKLVIGTGLSHEKDFIMAFNGADTIFKPADAITVETISEKSLKWLPINDGRTILAIVPFLGGPYGLNSDTQLGAFGQRIGQICTQAFGNSWTLTAP